MKNMPCCRLSTANTAIILCWSSWALACMLAPNSMPKYLDCHSARAIVQGIATGNASVLHDLQVHLLPAH